VNSVNIRPAHSGDLTAIHRLLVEAGLPTEGLHDVVDNLLAAESEGTVCGAIGFEHYGEDALVRSAVVCKERQGQGIGARMYDELRKRAKGIGIRRFVLLTTTAEAYFRSRGFIAIDRSTVKGPMANSVEFTTACPSSATCMELIL